MQACGVVLMNNKSLPDRRHIPSLLNAEQPEKIFFATLVIENFYLGGLSIFHFYEPDHRVLGILQIFEKVFACNQVSQRGYCI